MNHTQSHTLTHFYIAIHLCIEMRMKKQDHCSDFLRTLCQQSLAYSRSLLEARMANTQRKKTKYLLQGLIISVLFNLLFAAVVSPVQLHSVFEFTV